MTDTVAPPSGVGGCREVGPGESSAVLRVLAADPFVTVPAAEKVLRSGITAGSDGRFLTRGGPDRSLVYVESSVLPIRGDAADLDALGRAVVDLGVGPMSTHGRREMVAGLGPALVEGWGPIRDYRSTQFLMALHTRVDPALVLDGVRPATLQEFDPVLVAAAEMYREELRADPFVVGSGVPFRRRVARSVARGRTFVGTRSGEVYFKADVAAISERIAQIQGVWVHPRLRGTGLGAGGTAAVCAALQDQGLTPSLVVNGSNLPARAAYRRVGMVEVVEYATILM